MIFNLFVDEVLIIICLVCKCFDFDKLVLCDVLMECFELVL